MTIDAAAEARSDGALPREPVLLAILGLCMAVAPASTDMYLPALTAVRTDLHASAAQVQMTLSVFMLGFGIGQLMWGPLSDRFGRRPPIFCGILIYVLGGIGSALSSNIETMSVFRFAQAFGGCAMPVIAQAVIADLYGRERGARALSTMLLVMAVAPIVAPLLGGQLLLFASWRAIFWVLTGFGVMALLCLLAIPETLPPQARRSMHVGELARSYLVLLRDLPFMGYSLCGASMFGAALAYIIGTPFVYIELFGVSPQAYGLLFGANIIGMVIITTINRHLVMRVGLDRLLRIGVLGGFGCACLLLLAAIGGQRGGWHGAVGLATIALPIFGFMSLRGFVNGNAVAGAMSLRPERAGAASALGGALQFGFGALGGSLLSWFGDGTARPMAGVLAGFCACACLAHALLVPRQRMARR